MAVADLDEDFGLKQLIDQPRYCYLLVRKRLGEKLQTTVKLSICKELDEVAAIGRLDVVAWTSDQLGRMIVRLKYLASDEQHHEM